MLALYLESLGNPRKFARIARRVGRHKPIIVVKSGRQSAGARATSSHTGALLGASDVTVDALFHQAGVVRTDTLGEFFDVASLLANQPLPAGRRVAILTNGGGPGILATDACEADGLVVPRLPADVRAKLAEFLAPEAALDNPVDMIAASPETFRRAIATLAACEEIDALIVLFVLPLDTRTEDVAVAIRDAVLELPRRIPVLSVFMSGEGGPAALRNSTARVPAYELPRGGRAGAGAGGAVRGVARGAARERAEVRRSARGRGGGGRGGRPGTRSSSRWRHRGPSPGRCRERPSPVPRSPPSRPTGGRAGWAPTRSPACWSATGSRSRAWRLVDSPEAAGAAAEAIGGPVALKAVAPGVVHKTEARAVALSLEGAAPVERAAREMAASLEHSGHQVERFFVQQMVPPGVEMLVGVVHDRLFGPVVACAAGGTTAELLRDVAVRITPLTDRDAADMVRSLATFPLLDGYRGAPRADVRALEQILLRVSAMVEAHPEMVEMDCNPLIVLEEGAVVVDARIRIELPQPR